MTSEERAERKRYIESQRQMLAPTQIVDRKAERDWSARFKLVGGPFHDKVVRLWPPFDELRFPNGSVYELHPPLDKRSARYVYVHNIKASNSIESAEGRQSL